MEKTASQSKELFDQACTLFPGGVNSPVRAFGAVGGDPFFVKEAKGSCLITEEGESVLDYVQSWGALILGHAHPAVVEAIQQQASRGTSYGASHKLEIELADQIQKLVPSIEKLRFVNSGTEAVMSAIRLARGATGRDKIVKFEGCYHGHADSLLVKAGSGAATFGVPNSGGIPADLAQHTLTLPFNDVAKLDALFAESGSEVACVILEPVPGNMGVIHARSEFLKQLRELTQKSGSILIFDEVMSGFRVALGGAQEHFKIKPDLTTLGKIIGAGLPVGAFGGKAELMDQLAPSGPVYQAGTLSGNPLAMAAGIAALKEIQQPGFYSQLEALSDRLEKGIRGAVESSGRSWQVHRLGSMITLFFNEKDPQNFDDVGECDFDLFSKYFQTLLQNNVFIPPSQYEAWFVSSSHTVKEIDKTIGLTQSFLQEV